MSWYDSDRQNYYHRSSYDQNYSKCWTDNKRPTGNFNAANGRAPLSSATFRDTMSFFNSERKSIDSRYPPAYSTFNSWSGLGPSNMSSMTNSVYNSQWPYPNRNSNISDVFGNNVKSNKIKTNNKDNNNVASSSVPSEKKKQEQEAKIAYYKFKESLPKGLVKICAPLKCYVCLISLNSFSSAMAHYDGKTHKRKIERIFNGDSPQSGSTKKTHFEPIICKFCDVTLTSAVQSRDHFSGKNHIKKLNASEKWIDPPEPISITPKLLLNPKIGSSKKEDIVIKHWKKSFKEYTELSKKVESEHYCKICNVYTLSAEALSKHILEPKHINLEKSRNSSITFNNSDLVKYKSANGGYYCSCCDYSADDASLFINHLENILHKCQSKKK